MILRKGLAQVFTVSNLTKVTQTSFMLKVFQAEVLAVKIAASSLLLQK